MEKAFKASKGAVAKNYNEGTSRITYSPGHVSQHQQDVPGCEQDHSEEAELHMKGFWWCPVKAWDRGLHLQLPLQQVSGASHIG